MPDRLTLTGIAGELNEKAVAAALEATQGFDAAKVLSGDAGMVHCLFRGEGLAVAYKVALDLLCDYLAQECEKPDELQALREAVRRVDERLAVMAADANVAFAQDILHTETGPHMGEGEQ